MDVFAIIGCKNDAGGKARLARIIQTHSLDVGEHGLTIKATGVGFTCDIEVPDTDSRTHFYFEFVSI